MQGRITKVLNMRPAEILGMIEEAAGTRMYEQQKEKAYKAMGKKEKRLVELSATLEEEVEQKLNQQRADKKNFIQYQKSATELEKIGRVLRAWEYCEAEKRVDEKEREIAEAGVQKKQIEVEMKKATKERQQAEKDHAEVVKKRDAEMKKGGRLAKLKAEAEELGKQMVKIRTQAEIKQATISEEEKSLEGIQAEITNVSSHCLQGFGASSLRFSL